MSYVQKYRGRGRRRRSMGGLDANGFDNCPAGQINDANNNCITWVPDNPGVTTPGEGTPSSPPASSSPSGGGSSPSGSAGGGFWSSASSLIGGLLGRGPTPLMPLQTGPSTTEILVLAALGIGGVYLLTKD